MRGCPKSFETKMDYLNALQDYPEQTRAALRQLLASRFVFVKERELEEGEEGVVDETHNVATETERDEKSGAETQTRWQTVRQEDPNARLFRLGFTVSEVEKLL